MIELPNLSLAERVRRNETSLTDSYPSDISQERWDQITFDLEVDPKKYFPSLNLHPNLDKILQSSEDLYELFNSKALDDIDTILANLFSFFDLRLSDLEKALKIVGSNRVRVLSAHGRDSVYWLRKRWFYYENNRKVELVQDWIDRHSQRENYGALVISSCNPGDRVPRFRGVPIFYFKGTGCGLDGKGYVVSE